MKNINFCLLQFVFIFAVLIICIAQANGHINTPKIDVSTLHGAGNKPSIVGVFYFIMKTKICGIYKITSPSGKIYIGQSTDIKNRWSAYKGLNCKKQTKLHASLLRYGHDKHKFEIVEQCAESELNGKEKYYVDLYQTFNSKYGMNLKDGGGNKARQSEESKKRMSNARKGRKMPEETKEKLRKINTGKKRSEEVKRKMSIIAKGRNPITQETRNKMSKSSTGRKHTEETKNKMSKSQKKKVQSAPLLWRMRALKNGIGTKGEDRYNAKLTAQQVIEIRTKYWNLKQANMASNSGEVAKLMKEYKASRTNFYRIINKKLWKHVHTPI